MTVRHSQLLILLWLIGLLSLFSCQQRYAHRAKVKMPQEKQAARIKPEIDHNKGEESGGPTTSTKRPPINAGDEFAKASPSPEEKSSKNQQNINQALEPNTLSPAALNPPRQQNWSKRMEPESLLPGPLLNNSKENFLIFLTFLFWIVLFQLLLASLSFLVVFIVLYSPFFALTIPAGFILEKVLIAIGIYLISLILPYMISRNRLIRKYGINPKQPDYIILFLLALLTSFIVPMLLVPLGILGAGIYFILLFILGFRLMVGNEK